MNIPKLKMVSATAISAGAGATYVPLRAPAGTAWRVIWARGHQNDGAVTMFWRWTDPDTADTEIIGSTATGAWDPLILAVHVTAAGNYQLLLAPPWVTYARYFRFSFTASAAAKTGYVYALVEEYTGMEDE